DLAENWFRHSIGIVHSVERNRRSQWRMRPHERNKTEERARTIGLFKFFHPAISWPPFSPPIGRKRAALAEVKHLRTCAHGLLQEVELRMLPCQPRTVIVAFAIWRVIGFFATPQRFETEIFVPWIGMKLSDSEGSIAEARHCSSQVCSAARFHLRGLAVR